MPFIVANYVSACSQGQCTHSARTKNAIYIGHLCFCLQPRAAYALRSDHYPLCPFSHSGVWNVWYIGPYAEMQHLCHFLGSADARTPLSPILVFSWVALYTHPGLRLSLWMSPFILILSQALTLSFCLHFLTRKAEGCQLNGWGWYLKAEGCMWKIVSWRL